MVDQNPRPYLYLEDGTSKVWKWRDSGIDKVGFLHDDIMTTLMVEVGILTTLGHIIPFVLVALGGIGGTQGFEELEM